MSKLAWLTKDSIPARAKFEIELPNNELWLADFLGNFFSLAKVENWEEIGALTPLEMADEWLEVFLLFAERQIMSLPVGSILAFGGSVAPDGFFLCDFSEFNRSDFADLFAVIGTSYGAGNGTTTANLPFLQGRIPIGLDVLDADFNNLGDFGGQKNVTLEVAEMPVHGHVQDAHNHGQAAHNHVQNSHNHGQNSHNHIQDSHTHDVYFDAGAGSGTTRRQVIAAPGPPTTTVVSGGRVATNQAATAVNLAVTASNQLETASNVAATATNQNTGGGESHNNMPPYLVVNYIIKY